MKVGFSCPPASSGRAASIRRDTELGHPVAGQVVHLLGVAVGEFLSVVSRLRSSRCITSLKP